MIEIFDAGFARNPWPILENLRRDGGVHRVATPDGPPAWLVTRCRDVRAGLLDSRLSANAHFARGEDYRGFAVPHPLNTVQNADAAGHVRVRQLVAAEFSRRRFAEWDRLAPELVDSLLSTLGTGEVDFVTEFAVPLPTLVLTELLGLGDSQREMLLEWARSTLTPTGTEARARDTLSTMHEVIAGTIEYAKANREDTVLARIVSRYDGSAPQQCDELVGLLFYLLFVWYEILVDFISGSVLAMLNYPEQREAFLSATTSDAVDELLRFLSPQVLAGPRFATADLTIGSQLIRSGETVLLCLAGANHDPDQYDRPEILDFTKNRGPHTALGHGIHTCLGTALVHTISNATLERFFDRWPETRLAVEENGLRWCSGFRHRGPNTLPITLA